MHRLMCCLSRLSQKIAIECRASVTRASSASTLRSSRSAEEENDDEFIHHLRSSPQGTIKKNSNGIVPHCTSTQKKMFKELITLKNHFHVGVARVSCIHPWNEGGGRSGR